MSTCSFSKQVLWCKDAMKITVVSPKQQYSHAPHFPTMLDTHFGLLANLNSWQRKVLATFVYRTLSVYDRYNLQTKQQDRMDQNVEELGKWGFPLLELYRMALQFYKRK